MRPEVSGEPDNLVHSKFLVTKIVVGDAIRKLWGDDEEFLCANQAYLTITC